MKGLKIMSGEIETILKAGLSGDLDNLPTPKSRIGILLKELIAKVAEGGGGSGGGSSEWIEGGSFDIVKNTYPSEIVIKYGHMDSYGDKYLKCDYCHLIRTHKDDNSAIYRGEMRIYNDYETPSIYFGSLEIELSGNEFIESKLGGFELYLDIYEDRVVPQTWSSYWTSEPDNWSLFEEGITVIAYKP